MFLLKFGNKKVKDHPGDIHSFPKEKKINNLHELERSGKEQTTKS